MLCYRNHHSVTINCVEYLLECDFIHSEQAKVLDELASQEAHKMVRGGR